MKNLAAIGIAGSLLFSAAAIAQTATVQISPQQRTEIRQYMVQEKVRPVVIQERMAIGSTMSPNVDLNDFPAKWGDIGTKYRYVYSNNNVYLVDPGSRRVVDVIE